MIQQFDENSSNSFILASGHYRVCLLRFMEHNSAK